ncbi:MAG: 30S ribosomal protein S17 [Chlamydiota bacterium]
MTNPARGKRKRRVGTVVSDASGKTVIVEVGRVQRHAKYDKVMRAHTRCYVHDEGEEAGTGDVVRIEECRPMSRLKRWRLVEIVKKGKGVSGPAGTEEDVREIEESIRGRKEAAPAAAAAIEERDRVSPGAGAAVDERGGAAT